MTNRQKMQLLMVKQELLDGLVYDGGHHKQAHLERALQALLSVLGDKRGKGFKALKNELDWEEGIG